MFAMKRRRFFSMTGGTVLIAAAAYYLQTDKRDFNRDDLKTYSKGTFPFMPDEEQILSLASLDPSGHNTQPWSISYLKPYHWIIGSDETRWLPAVDPGQRETVLSIGAFVQNIEFAANHFGYDCQYTSTAKTNQDKNLMTIQLAKSDFVADFDIQKIKQRRTIRSNYLNNQLTTEDCQYLLNGESDFIQYIPNPSPLCTSLNEQTVSANQTQSYRDPAQKELADWIRFSNKDAAKYKDGLTIASMEINGVSAWVLRNFYGKSDVMKKDFREQNIDNVKKQVSESAGWLLITSIDDSTDSLLQTGRRLQRLLLKIRERNIAIHPMTQILEESATNKSINKTLGIKDSIQFILRVGYVKSYPAPVSLRRSVETFVRS